MGTDSLRDQRLAAAGEALVEAARPYIDNAAPHEKLFSGTDLRNFEALTAAVKAWDDLMNDEFMAALEVMG